MIYMVKRKRGDPILLTGVGRDMSLDQKIRTRDVFTRKLRTLAPGEIFDWAKAHRDELNRQITNERARTRRHR